MGRRRKIEPLASNPSVSKGLSTFWLALAGAGLLWAAFPPLGLAWLAWIAPVPWLVLVRSSQLAGWRPYLAIWAVGAIFWLVLLHGITKAHWLNHFGWVALSFYLATYLPGFVALTRVALHRYRISLVWAAPVVWTGLELLRGHLLTGFSMGLVAHTQVEWTTLIQISDLFGAYGVSFVVLLVAACLARMLPADAAPRVFWPLLPMFVVLGVTLSYGIWKMSAGNSARSTPLKVALIQRVVDTKFESNPKRNLDTFYQYWDATERARKENPDLDLIIWPESVFSENNPEVQCERNFFLPDDIDVSREEFFSNYQKRRAAFQDKLRNVAEHVNHSAPDVTSSENTSDVYLLVGTETVHFGTDKVQLFNSALLINPAGKIVDRYYKMHPVMFGEYIPLGKWLPIIYQIAPMSQGVTAGERPEAFEVAGTTLAPSICFESSVPHLIRRQVVELARQGASPDVLVNITHDGWFFGSSILDHQFAGAVFRAVELRRPVLVAANAGISCWVDGSGQVRARGPRRGNDVIVAEVQPDGRWSGYQVWGDLPVALCLLACCLLLIGEVWARHRARRAEAADADPHRE